MIGRTIREAGARPIAILDQRRIVVPRGVDYRPAGEDWFEIVRALARQAHTVIVIAPPDESVRAGLERELRMLLEDGHEAKTVLVAPPGGDVGSHAVVGHAARQLGWSPPPQSPLVCFRQGNTVRSYGSFHHDVFQTDICQQALATALGRDDPTEKGN